LIMAGGAPASYEPTSQEEVALVVHAEDEDTPPTTPETRGLAGSVLGGACQWLCCGSCSWRGGKGERYGLKFPTSAEQLRSMGAPWVTRAMRAAGKIGADVSCTSMTVKPLGESGLLGEMNLVSWEFSEDVSIPAQVVAKFQPHNNMKLQALGSAMGLFATEYHFYKLVNTQGFRYPRLIWGDFHYRSTKFALFLEKIDGTVNFLKHETTSEEHEKMVRVLATWHAQFVGRTGSPELAFAPRIEDPSQQMLEKIMAPNKHWVQSQELLCAAAELKDYDVKGTYKVILPFKPQIIEKCWTLLHELADVRLGWRTLCHCDTRADNFFFPPDSSEAGLLDFQILKMHTMPFDVMYHILSSQKVEDWTPDASGRMRMVDLFFDTLRQQLPAGATPQGLLGDEAGAREEFMEIVGLLICYQVSLAFGAACAIFNL
jgi:hypothetical protein